MRKSTISGESFRAYTLLALLSDGILTPRNEDRSWIITSLCKHDWGRERCAVFLSDSFSYFARLIILVSESGELTPFKSLMQSVNKELKKNIRSINSIMSAVSSETDLCLILMETTCFCNLYFHLESKFLIRAKEFRICALLGIRQCTIYLHTSNIYRLYS